MTPDEKRVAIAEACGWKPYVCYSLSGGDNCTRWKRGSEDRNMDYLPDYRSDRNTIYDAIRGQPHHVQWAIFTALAAIVEPEIPAAFGSAEQYADAFLAVITKETP
jgi:hypothetical protein